MNLIPKLLIDKTRLQEIYDLRVAAWERSSRSDLVNSKLFPNGWTDKLDESAFHFIIEDDNKIVAAARLNILSSLDDLVEKEVFEKFQLPQELPFGLISRLVVSHDYRNLGLSGKLDDIRHEYAQLNKAKFLLATSGDLKRVNSLIKNCWTILGKVKIKYHSGTLLAKDAYALICKEGEEISVWGRNLAEYNKMFSLDTIDHSKKILSVADGPASFNYEMSLLGNKVTSMDPIYGLKREEVKEKISKSTKKMIEKLQSKRSLFTMENLQKTDDLIAGRLKSMNAFIEDYEQGKIEGRYVHGTLPNIPFTDKSFDLCICANLLFLFEEYFTEENHIDSIKEMLRVAKEIRIFPLHNRKGEQSSYLEKTISQFSDKYKTLISDVDYEVYKGGNKQLIISE